MERPTDPLLYKALHHPSDLSVGDSEDDDYLGGDGGSAWGDGEGFGDCDPAQTESARVARRRHFLHQHEGVCTRCCNSTSKDAAWDEAAPLRARREGRPAFVRHICSGWLQMSRVEAGVGVCLLVIVLTVLGIQGPNFDTNNDHLPDMWIRCLQTANHVAVGILTLEVLVRILILKRDRSVYSLKHNLADVLLQLVILLASLLERIEAVSTFYGVLPSVSILACIMRFWAIGGRRKTRAHATHVSAADLAARARSVLGDEPLPAETAAALRDVKMNRDLASRNRIRVARAFFGSTYVFFIKRQPFTFAATVLFNLIWAAWGPTMATILGRVSAMLTGQCDYDNECAGADVCGPARVCIDSAGHPANLTSQPYVELLELYAALAMICWFATQVVAQGLVYALFARLEAVAARDMRACVLAFAVAPCETNVDRFTREELMETMHTDVSIAVSVWSYVVCMWSVLQAAGAVSVSVYHFARISPWSLYAVAAMVLFMLVQVAPSHAFRIAEVSTCCAGCAGVAAQSVRCSVRGPNHSPQRCFTRASSRCPACLTDCAPEECCVA